MYRVKCVRERERERTRNVFERKIEQERESKKGVEMDQGR